MGSRSNTAKLAELRARTNQQLVKVVRAELEFGLRLAAIPLAGSKARKSLTRIEALLARLDGVSTEERASLDAQVEELRLAVEGSAATPSCCHTASF